MPYPAQPTARALAWPTDGLAYGGDYNPEQWDEDTWIEDVRLMREAGVNLVTVGVFSWGLLETHDDVWDFAWLDRVLQLLHDAGIAVDLATPTAAPPIWLHQAHPQILPVSRQGVRYAQGGRLGWCASSPVWRRYALRVVDRLAQRYADHPAVRMWHVGNEFGGGNRHCYCDESAAHFRAWLGRRYPSIQALNAAWGTAFWGHNYTSFEQILPPRDSESAPNPAVVLDFDRFSSEALFEHYAAEREVILRHSADRPITTNFMIQQGPDVVDYARWAPHVDVVANDHYLIVADELPEEELAFGADRVRGLYPSRPWLLMEHSTGAVNWQPRNRAKAPGEMMRNSLGHVARGADGALFFQWRASTAGAEQFHSAMVPHAGTRARIWREVVQLGAAMRALAPVRGSLVQRPDVAILYDDEAGWAWASGQKPHHALPYPHAARQWHRALWEAGVVADIVPPTAALDGYRLVIVPALYLSDAATAQRLAAAAEAGATVVVTYLSGIVDRTGRVIGGGYPGAFRELLGVVSEEFFVLLDGERVDLDNGWSASTWTEALHADRADVVARYAAGALAGWPAITRRGVGEGSAWYVSARLEPDGARALADLVAAEAGVRPVVPGAGGGLEAVRRSGEHGDFLFLINHTGAERSVASRGRELLTGAAVDGRIAVPPGAVRVVHESR
jgi:beta-galactosidase